MNFIHGQLGANASGPNRPGSTVPPTQTPTAAPPPNSNLPLSNLESLRFKANQIIDSIQALQNIVETGMHFNQMPSWPDVLTKYNILLSQTHSFSVGLAGITGGSGGQANAPGGGKANAQPNGAGGPGGSTTNILERIVLHPSVSMPDAQLEAEVIPLLRNQQTNDVLRAENETVRRLSEHMTTRGSVGVLAPQTSSNPPGYGGFGREKKPIEYEDVLRECEEIRNEHDRRVDRAVRAVAMLREKFEWKQRVEVEVEEPEELEWDPRARGGLGSKEDGVETDGEGGDEEMEDDDDSEGEGKGDNSSSPGNGPGGANGGDANMEEEEGSDGDENEVQAMVDSAMEIQTPPTTINPGGSQSMVIDVDAMS